MYDADTNVTVNDNDYDKHTISNDKYKDDNANENYDTAPILVLWRIETILITQLINIFMITTTNQQRHILDKRNSYDDTNGILLITLMLQ